MRERVPSSDAAPSTYGCRMRPLLLFVAVGAAVAASALSADGASSRPGALTVAFSFDTSRGRPIEGAISYVSIERDGGSLLTAQLNGNYGERSIAVPAKAGRYLVRTYQRFCSGNCGSLDDPTYVCSRSVEVGRRERVLARVPITFAPGSQSCRIRVSR
jgi:hypothetical protein